MSRKPDQRPRNFVAGIDSPQQRLCCVMAHDVFERNTEGCYQLDGSLTVHSTPELALPVCGATGQHTMQERIRPMFGTDLAGNRAFSRLTTGAATLLVSCGVALATEGQPAPWQMNLQPAATPVAESIHSFHTLLLWIIIPITLFVLVLLAIIVVKFGEKANPTPSKTTHHTMLEVVWTVVPVLILVIIAIPSFRLLKYQEVVPPSDITIKLTGKQWYWSVEYAKDSGGISFDALLMNDEDIAKALKNGGKKEDYPRLLAVDNEIVLPVNKVVRVQVTAADVIHAFSVQSFGVKVDAVPGRLNQTWFQATKEGVFYGQCQELCGKDHAFMPLAIRVVAQDKYEAWLKDAQKKFALSDPAPVKVAASDDIAR